MGKSKTRKLKVTQKKENSDESLLDKKQAEQTSKTFQKQKQNQR